ncbi:MAG: UDP-N-acetylmuramoyl-L-alanyl-D-glutamate--2,6-diaminopimelate ligase [Lachnospiraceae bacterium]|nr:UDP-N-acetylmuramoyl-L-alanyl-D-glutamate--2,6-diaminopimelate ligase [Lachnospiraceae bacterium]
MKLAELLEKTEYEVLRGSTDIEITEIVNDSRKVKKGCVFPCIRGASFDGHKFAAEVASKGAAAIVAEEDVDVPDGVTVILVKDSRIAMARMACAWFGYPADRLKMIGITGTKGKTTTTYMVKSILESAGHKVGLIGTIETLIGSSRIPSANTTPESLLLQEYLAKMVKAGCDAVVMEVSSQALMLHRVEGITFDIGVFTNISADHIGPAEHSSFEDYMECKSRLFKMCRRGIFNGDDIHLGRIMEGHTCSVETFGLKNTSDLYADGIELVYRPGYLGTKFCVRCEDDYEVTTDIPGKFSVYNSLCAIAVCRHFGVTKEQMQSALADVKVKGRVEMVKVSDDFILMIDYAHNAMALESILSTLREYHPSRIVCVFGCGGNRARSRRYEMGEVSGRHADFTILTSDNPRYEDPEAILDDIEVGMKRTKGRYIRIADRREAIAYAIHNGQPGDVIVLAGKGHEDYQEICGKKYPMDERVLIADILAEDAKKEN